MDPPPAAPTDPTQLPVQDSSLSGGSGSGGRYDQLLAQVQQVQHELQLARVVIQQLREDNTTLKSNWEHCQQELVRTRTKYNRSKEDLLTATERQIKGDRQHEALVDTWKTQLQERTEELEAMQAKLVPQNLDLLRIKIQEELEAPHLLKVAELEGELRKFEALFYSVRRAYEKDKAEHALFREQMQASIQSDRAVFDAEVTELARRLREAESRQNDSSLDDSLLSAQQDAQASAVRERRLLAEINELRAESNEGVRRHQNEISSFVERLARAEASAAQAEADSHNHQHRCAQMTAKVVDLEAVVASLRESQQEAVAELEQRRMDLELREKKMQDDERRRVREIDRFKHSLESDVRRLEHQLQHEAEVARAAAAAAEKKELLASERVARALASEEECRSSARKAIDGAEVVTAAAQEELAGTNARLKTQEYESTLALRAKDAQLAELTASHAKACKELELCRSRADKALSEAHAERLEKDAVAKKYDAEATTARRAEERAQVAERKALEAQDALDQKTAEAQQLQQECNALSEQLDEQRSDHVTALANVTAQHAAERDSLAAAVRKQREDVRASQAAAHREAKKAEKYKKAAQSAHNHSKRAKQQALDVIRHHQQSKPVHQAEPAGPAV